MFSLITTQTTEESTGIDVDSGRVAMATSAADSTSTIHIVELM